MVALLFVLLVGSWMWFLLNQTGAARTYAQQALAAAAGQTVPPAGLPCTDLVGQPLPNKVLACVVKPGSPLTAELTFEGDRKGVVRAAP